MEENERRQERRGNDHLRNESDELIQRLPQAPKDFTRFPFVDKRGDPNFGAPSLLEYVAQRYSSTDSRYGRLNQILMFFAYIETNYGDAASAGIAGRAFRHPISRQFDLPRVEDRKTGV